VIDDDTDDQKSTDNITPYKAQKEVDNNKDNNLSIFHAIGKFLYNKRIDNTTKEAR